MNRTSQDGQQLLLDIFPGESRLLTAKELAEGLAISEKTVYAYVSKGLIPFIKIQSNVRFHPRAIREWLEQKQYRPAETRQKRQVG